MALLNEQQKSISSDFQGQQFSGLLSSLVKLLAAPVEYIDCISTRLYLRRAVSLSGFASSYSMVCNVLDMRWNI